MSLCFSTAAGRGYLLFSRSHWIRRPVLALRTTTTVASAAAASTSTSLSPPQQHQVALYVEALLDWNQVRIEIARATQLLSAPNAAPYARGALHGSPLLCRVRAPHSPTRICSENEPHRRHRRGGGHDAPRG
jgi:hypothetical protein